MSEMICSPLSSLMFGLSSVPSARRSALCRVSVLFVNEVRSRIYTLRCSAAPQGHDVMRMDKEDGVWCQRGRRWG